ncbi:hypothetical protein BKA58DRAFT_392132 [Alternaria rosae]|uniref:uncharacterized protein n=1 Tax=Alternaria rosae TaxID=1187941 RepID=UPI001E8D3477|nr:uncharacterized protein BKA58DRAFT_392132 [Alternaria rosae]KAH6860779.1 hypothetical protein BKA58DRAFT_392132 [Alternaria rosae]
MRLRYENGARDPDMRVIHALYGGATLHQDDCITLTCRYRVSRWPLGVKQSRMVRPDLCLGMYRESSSQLSVGVLPLAATIVWRMLNPTAGRVPLAALTRRSKQKCQKNTIGKLHAMCGVHASTWTHLESRPSCWPSTTQSTYLHSSSCLYSSPEPA